MNHGKPQVRTRHEQCEQRNVASWANGRICNSIIDMQPASAAAPILPRAMIYRHPSPARPNLYPAPHPLPAMQRQNQIAAWLRQCRPDHTYTLTPASADASFRRYFRATERNGQTLIVMDAPPEHEDCRPWLNVQQLFTAAGVHVPHVLAQDLEHGFLLLSDLGSTTYLSALQAQPDPARARALYEDATSALVQLQKASRPGVLPDYDRTLLLRELMLFPEWYVGRHLGHRLDEAQQQIMMQAFERILATNLAEPRVFVHRDYHSRNLMLQENSGGHDDDSDAHGHPPSRNPGIIDFQDAVYGPLSYDLVSLFKDAYIDWEEELTLDWLVRYWEKARRAGLPVRADFGDFHRDYEWMGVQRHLKVLGIFARLYHRDGKEGYLKDMPLVLSHLRKACDRYRELGPFLVLLDQLEERPRNVGYTF
jgi:aminoglycoside/choline kinase family phosphotransferase